MTSTEACIALNMVPQMGPVRLRRLTERFGAPERILGTPASKLRQVDGIGPEVADNIARWEDLVDLTGELKRIETFGAHVVTQDSEDYPPLLREIHDPPMVLYVWGRLSTAERHSVGIVGSRRTSHYGLECAKRLSFQLAYAGMSVVSGLARGIDTAAHHGALAAQGRTIAVLGSGLNRLYPPENRVLAEKISASGAVVSEFSMEVTADRQTFPMRNRIISGMSAGLLVVEAGLNSGALISASQAIDQGRLVYAVPGPIDRPTAIGSNRLIQQGAKLVMDAGDILRDMEVLIPEKHPPRQRTTPRAKGLSSEECAVYDAIGDSETAVDEVITKSGLPASKVSSTLLTLEMRRLVKQLPGQYFVKLL
jgi:DNA processing protein